jgi:hypothetical protein
MTNQHPITPPPELVQQWADMLSSRSDHAVFSLAAQWGADQELEACCMWITREKSVLMAEGLGIARRPKPPTLKEQALAAMGRFGANTHTTADEMARDFDTIRRSIEAMPDELES